MIIVVNDIAASPGGGLTVLKEFYEAVKRSDKRIKWIFLLSKPYIEETENIKVVLMPKVKNHFNRLIFDLFLGRRIINSYNPSLFISLQNTIVFGCKCKSVVYVHQPLPFQSVKRYSFFKKSEFKNACIQYLLGYLIKKSIKNSDLTFVQTKWMKKAVKKQCRINNIKQYYPEMPTIKGKASYQTTNQFFYPTSTASYKNNEILINASKKLTNLGVEYSTIMTLEKENDDSNIKYLGRLPIDEVYKYYSNSCLVFPSYIETFGYPLVEARSVGSIILAADTLFSRELLDGYENAYFFNAFNENELVYLLKKVATQKIKRNVVSSVGNIGYHKNSWDIVVYEMIKVASKKK